MGKNNTNRANRPDADAWIQILNLKPHPEGGFFREIHRSAESIPAEALPARFHGARAFSTSIYFLLNAGQRSLFHRIQQDEVWAFHDGGQLAIHSISPEGRLQTFRLGISPDDGQQPQAVIPAGHLFAAELLPDAQFCLVGCFVAPGFDFADFEMPSATTILTAHPAHAEIIRRLARP